MRKLILAAATAAAVFSSPAIAAELLTNGNFETGNLSGWTVVDQVDGSGTWSIIGNGGATAINGFPTPTLATGGLFNAQTDQAGPGSHQLRQGFSAIAGGTYVLSFDAYASDLSGAAPVGSGLDYNTDPNQHIEIFLAGVGSPIFSTSFGTSWGHHSYDISSLITSNGSYTLSFGEVDNQGFYNFGLDNVSLSETIGAAAVPEPATWAMMFLGFGLIGGVMRRRQTVSLRYA